MPHDGGGNIETAPAGDAGTQAELRVIAEHEKVFVETADAIEHRFAVHSGRTIGPEALFHAVILAAIDLTCAAASVLAIGGIAMKSLPALMVAGMFAAAVVFALLLDLLKVPVFRRLAIT